MANLIEFIALCQDPSTLLFPLRTKLYTQLNHISFLRVYRVVQLTVNSAIQLDQAIISERFLNYLTLPPPPALPVINNPLGPFIEEPTTNAFQLVRIGGEGVLSAQSFLEYGYVSPTLTRMYPGARAACRSGAAPGATTFINDCRLLANVMYMFKITGQRFVSARALVNVFICGHNIGNPGAQPTARGSAIIREAETVTVDELWITFASRPISIG